jgi:hypothetical protein
LATADDEVNLAVGLLEHTIGVAPFGRRRWSLILSIIVVVIVVVLATSIIAPVTSAIVALVVAAIIPIVVMPIITVIATVVVVPIIAAIITSIPVVITTIGPAITVITSIRSTVPVVEALISIPVVIVASPSLLRGRRDPQGTLQLLALPHGVLSITVELTLIIHDHVEVAFEEGGRSWWICHVGFTRSFARPGSSITVIFSAEVVHHCVLSVGQFVDVGHEVIGGVCIGFMNLLE